MTSPEKNIADADHHFPELPERLTSRRADLHRALCDIKNLRSAYHSAMENWPLARVLDAHEVNRLLHELQAELESDTYRFDAASSDHQRDFPIGERAPCELREIIILFCLRNVLENEFSHGRSESKGSEAAVVWVAEMAAKGLTILYSETIENQYSPHDAPEKWLSLASEHIHDAKLKAILDQLLLRPDTRNKFAWELLGPRLKDLALSRVDYMLDQVRKMGRRDNTVHVSARRFGQSIILLKDHGGQYEWLLPAFRRRFRSELSAIGLESNSAELRSVDLSQGEKVRLLGFELHYVIDKRGKPRVEYMALDVSESASESKRKEKQQKLPSQRWSAARTYARGIGPAIASSYRKIWSVQVGLRHIPIALYPVLACFFGWRSPIAVICLCAVVTCNWRATLQALAMCWQRKVGLALAVCSIGAILSLRHLASDVNSDLTGVSPAPNMPAGFYLGRFNKGTLYDPDLIRFGLYVPPHLRHEQGPFPLLVFLHGYKEGNERVIFLEGPARSAANSFGPDTPNGLFPFITFLPIDPAGKWRPDSREVKDAMIALDYVIEKYRIDSSRIYLTGHSGGANGVWRLAQAFPDKWAALAPLSSHMSPDVQKVRHIPVWIFHSAKDMAAPVEREQNLVQQLRNTKADVRYTEIPTDAHVIQYEIYDAKELYGWLSTKKKTN